MSGEVPQQQDASAPSADAVTFAPRPRPIGSNGAIAVDLPCLKCRYNLRGLTEDGRCPECGEAIAPAVARYGRVPLEWLRRITGAVQGLMIISLQSAALCVGALLLSVLSGNPQPLLVIVPILILLGLAMLFCVPALAARADWLDPEGWRADSRVVARWSLFALPTCPLAAGLAALQAHPGSPKIALLILGTAFLVPAVILPVSVSRRVAQILDHLEYRRLATCARAWSWTALTAGTALLLALLASTLGGRDAETLAGSLAFVFLAVAFALILLAPLLLLRTGQALERSAAGPAAEHETEVAP